MRALACFVGAALISAATSSVLSGCLFEDDCTCPELPERPGLQDELIIDEVSAYSAAGDEDELPIDPRGGTAEITDDDQLVIRYERDGVERSVTYDVSPL